MQQQVNNMANSLHPALVSMAPTIRRSVDGLCQHYFTIKSTHRWLHPVAIPL